MNLTDIHSLTDFQRNVKDHLKHLKETGRPEILTVNGKAAVVVQDGPAGRFAQEVTVSTLRLVAQAAVVVRKSFKIRGKQTTVSRN